MATVKRFTLRQHHYQQTPMFMISESETAAILSAYQIGGEWAAVAELRRLFTGIQDNDTALQAVRAIVCRSDAINRQERTQSS